MDFEKLPISELVVAVVSIVGTILGTRLLDRRKEKREQLEKRRERIRAIVATLSDLEDDLQSLEAEFESMEGGMPHIAKLIAPLIQDTIELDESKIRNWQQSFEAALGDIKTLDVALYMRLLQEKRDFTGFFQRVLIPYLERYRPTQKERPELISMALREFLSDLQATIIGISKELPKKEQVEVLQFLGPVVSEDERSEGTQLEVLELIASAVPIPLEHPIERKDLEWLEAKAENAALGMLLTRFSELLVYLPGLMERVFFGNLKAMITPLILNQTDSLQEWLSIDDEKELEIEAAYEEFKFTTEEEATFVGNRDFGRLVLGIADRFGFEIPFQYRRCLVALEKGWISANELIIFWRDGRIPAIRFDRIQTVPILPAGYTKSLGSSDSYQFYMDQRARLDAYKDRIFCHPLTESEILQCEELIRYPLPPYFRDFLSVFGVKQDILPWLIWTDGAFFISNSFVPKADEGRFFAIGRITQHGHYFLSFSYPLDSTVYHLEFEPEKKLVPMGRFQDLLRDAIDEAINQYESRKLNSEKLRKVEFHFFSKDYDQVITPILDHIQAEELPAFQFDCIEHDVAIWKADLHFEGKTVTMQRQEGFDATQFPRYFLTMTEPVTDLKTGSFIEFIRNCYKEMEIGMQFLEYDFRGEQN